MNEQDEKDFQDYCDRFNYSRLVRQLNRSTITNTYHYKLFCLGSSIVRLKIEIKNALPKWLKWIIKVEEL